MLNTLLLMRRLAALAALIQAARMAYDSRMHAIREHGSVIHEFDPWFNFRATEYLVENGRHAFMHWFDHAAWYPLGRPVATTIYPAMQFTAAAIFHALQWAGLPWTLDDVCCFVPVWGGVISTIFTALLAYECAGQKEAAGAGAGLVMAILPAHLQRSVGGGFDNESVAMPAMCATFFWWCRALREPPASTKECNVSALDTAAAIAAAASYAYMAASWGGYVFVANIVAVHAGALLLLGRSPPRLHRQYTTFYILGTAGAVSVPVVGWTPLTHSEHLLPLAAVVAINISALWRALQSRGQAKAAAAGKQTHESVLSAHLTSLALASAAAAAVVALVVASADFGYVTVRVRALFLPHTRTGNPLVDSVAEHRPASAGAYHQYLNLAVTAAPVGAVVLLLRRRGPSDAALFLLLLAGATYFFSSKMSRLILLLAPPAASLSGVALGTLFEVGFGALILSSPEESNSKGASEGGEAKASAKPTSTMKGVAERVLRVFLLSGLVWWLVPHAQSFRDACDSMARYSLSHTQLTWKVSAP